MKKQLFTLCILALGQMTLAAEMDTLINQDSVIVEFGNSGKIVITLDDKEDFEKLKEMDLNAIVQELELELDDAKGKVTIVELRQLDGTREILRVQEVGPETRVSLGRWRVLVDESGKKTDVKVETAPRKKQEDPDFRTYGTLDLGVNNYFEEGSIPGGGAVYGVKGWGSWNVGLKWMASQKIETGKYWDFGLGVQWFNFKFENRGYQAINGEDGVEFLHRTDVDGFKSKISASYLTVLTLFRLDFGKLNESDRNGLRLAVGPYAGYRLGGRSKFVYREVDGSGRKKEKSPIGNNLTNFRYGLRGEIGFRSVTFFTSYDLNTLIQNGRGPTLHPIAFGLVF